MPRRHELALSAPGSHVCGQLQQRILRGNVIRFLKHFILDGPRLIAIDGFHTIAQKIKLLQYGVEICICMG